MTSQLPRLPPRAAATPARAATGLVIIEEADRAAAAEAAVTARAADAFQRAREAQLETLHPQQLKVVQRLHENAPLSSAAARTALLHRAEALGYTEADVQAVLDRIFTDSHLALHFWPDVPSWKHGPLWSSLIKSGQYTAGGQAKEAGMFDDLYSGTAVAKPKYAALNAEGPYASGAANGWGPAFLELKPEVSVRTSLTPSNSVGLDTLATMGTTEHCAHLLADPRISDGHFRRIFDYLLRGEFRPFDFADRPYIEGQIHGDVQLDRDLQAVVGVQKPKRAEDEDGLRALADHFGVPLIWHEPSPGLRSE